MFDETLESGLGGSEGGFCSMWVDCQDKGEYGGFSGMSYNDAMTCT